MQHIFLSHFYPCGIKIKKSKLETHLQTVSWLYFPCLLLFNKLNGVPTKTNFPHSTQDQCRSSLFSDEPQLPRMESLHAAEHMGHQVLIAWFCNTWFRKFLHILLIIIISVRLTQQTSQSSWALQEVFQRYNGVNQRALVSTEGKGGEIIKTGNQLQNRRWDLKATIPSFKHKIDFLLHP